MNNCYKTILNFSFPKLLQECSHKHPGTIYYTNCNIPFYHSLVNTMDVVSYLTIHLSIFGSTTERKVSKIFFFQYNKLDDYKTHVVYTLFEMDFAKNKEMQQKPMQRDHSHSRHVEFEQLEIYCYFTLGEKRMAAICFFV